MDLINFNNFSYRYKGNEEYALNNISLNIRENKFILLAGETGSGKTSLIRCINGLIPQFYAGFYKGSVEIAGRDTVETPIADLSTIVGIVFQNPENQLVAMTVENEIAFGMENLGISRDEMIKRIDENVKLTEIAHLLHKAPFELSGGEQQRVAIASILVLKPKILILDEPTALLDPYMAKKILNLLKAIQVERNITVIISEHRMDLILPLVDEIILMKEGHVIEYDDKDKIINGENFKNLEINRPIVYSMFNDLHKNKIIRGNIPASIPEAIKYLEDLK
jgi:energy-coupling factor transporter ATP-binding protein EcfA2